MVREILDKILYPFTLMSIPGNCTLPTVFKFKYPSLAKRRELDFLKNMKLVELKDSHISSYEELISLAIENGSLDKDYKLTQELLSKEIRELNSDIDAEKNLTRKNKLKRKKESIAEQLDSIDSELASIFMASAESRVDSFYLDEFLNSSLYDLSDNLLKIDTSDIKTVNAIVEYINKIEVPEKDIRLVARSSEWRILWQTCKKNISQIFGSVVDLNSNQLSLINWSFCYDSFLEDPNRPDISVMNDDDQFDIWLESRGTKKFERPEVSGHKENGIVVDGYFIDKCTCSVGAKKKGLGESAKHADSCEYGKFVKYSPVEKQMMIDKIYGKNSKVSRDIIHSEYNKLEKNGVLSEQQLRDRKTRTVLGLYGNTKNTKKH